MFSRTVPLFVTFLIVIPFVKLSPPYSSANDVPAEMIITNFFMWYLLAAYSGDFGSVVVGGSM